MDKDKMINNVFGGGDCFQHLSPKRKLPQVNLNYLLLATVLLIQILALVYIAANKEGLHIDEYYSYILSNSYDTDRIANAPDFWNRWLDGNAFQEFLTVEEGEAFAFHTVYENNAKDAHPPLFYYLLHFVCSFFTGKYSPWIGMGMNIALIVLAQLVLFRLGKQVMNSNLWAIVPVAIYGGMQFFADTTLFIRMYALVTLLTILLVKNHYQIFVSEKKQTPILWCCVVTFLGAFTQYYFAIFAFFLAAATCFWMLLHKQWKTLILYSAAMLFAVASVFLVFPAGITQITGSETNNVGAEVASNILNFSGWGSAMKSMIRQCVKGMFNGTKHCIVETTVLMLVTIIASMQLRSPRNEDFKTQRKQSLYFFVFLSVITALSIAAITHISGKFTYVRYLYNLFPMVALLFVLGIWLFSSVCKLNRKVLASGIIAIGLVNTYTIADDLIFSYGFSEKSTQESLIIEQCADKPLIILNNGTTYQPTALMNILLNSTQVYMANYNDMAEMDSVLEQIDCTQGVMYLILTDTYWSNGFDGDALMREITNESHILENYSECGKCDFSTVYTAWMK